jgi:hypothetical protein
MVRMPSLLLRLGLCMVLTPLSEVGRGVNTGFRT